MNVKTTVLLSCVFSACAIFFLNNCTGTQKTRQSASLNLDLSKPADNLTAFLKMRISTTENEEVYFYASGTIYSFVAGERDRPLLGFDMYNVGKIQKMEGGYQMLTREVGFYKDLQTGAIIESWQNPWTNKNCEVVHVWNDPVNQKFALEGKFGKWGIPYHDMGNGRICLNSDIFLTYPSPLTIAEFPDNAASDTYEAAELFQFFADKKDLNNPAVANAPAEVSWTRIGPFLPWMGMGQRPGNLVYQCRGYKISGPGAWERVPQQTRDYVMKHHPEFAHAPDTYTTPNETSWTYFKKLKSGKK